MATDIIMPQLGESVAEGTVVKWFIRPGGMIQKDQALLEVETEKVDLDIPSPVTGVLSEIIIPEGGTVPVGTLLARIESTPPSDVINRVGGVIVRPSQPVSDGDGRYSPAVRQLATAHGLDLSHVKGTGTGGRVTKKDVQEFIAETGGLAASPPAGTELSMGEEVRPLTQMRRTIAERMVSSRRTSAHVTTFFEADFSGVAKFRDTLRQSSGQSVTYLPFVIRAVTRAIRDLPVLNSSWR